MRTGDFRHLISLYRPPNPDETDEWNQPLDKPVLITKVKAAIEPLRGREFFSARQDQAEVTTRVRTRFRPGLKEASLAIDESTGNEFELMFPIHVGFEKRELQFMAKERY